MDSSQKTDGSGPVVESWHLKDSAFCGSVQCDDKTEYQVMIPVGVDSFWFDPRPSFQSADGGLLSDVPCRLVGSDGNFRIMSCEEAQDEKILLITARSGFEGDFGTVTALGGAEIISAWCSKRGTYRVAHILAKITAPDGHVMTETGFKSSFGLTEVYSWCQGYLVMPTPRYKDCVLAGTLFQDRDTVADELVKIRQQRLELEKSQKEYPKYEPRLAEVNQMYQEAGLKMPFVLSDGYFCYMGYTGLEPPRYFLYGQQDADGRDVVEQLVSQMLAAFGSLASYHARKIWKSQFEAVAAQYSFDREDQCGTMVVSYGDLYVTVCCQNASQTKATIQQFLYSQAGLEEFLAAMDEYQARGPT